MMRLTFEIVGKTLFDTEVDADASEVGEALTVAMECAMGQLESLVPVPPVVPTPTNLRYRRAVARLDKVIFRIIRERRAQGDDRGDVLSMLLAARDEDGGAMTDAEVRDQAMTLFLAGHETTANAMAWTFHLLAKNPDVRERLEAELDALGRTPSYEDLAKLPYALACMKESMRLYPPAYVLARRAIKDVTLGEQRFRKGSILIISVIGIHHRDSLFPDAERFDPTRFLGDKEKQLPRCAYIPFGAGPRICIGNHFALMEAHVLLATLARRARFDHATSAPVSYEPLVTLRPKELAMRVSLRELRTARVA
jgi:cytochrome P450